MCRFTTKLDRVSGISSGQAFILNEKGKCQNVRHFITITVTGSLAERRVVALPTYKRKPNHFRLGAAFYRPIQRVSRI